MKPTSTFSLLAGLCIAILAGGPSANAQQYKMRQVNNMAGMKSETTVYVKGMRKRTEGGGYAGMTALTTIEQCDLQRTIKINDKKKLYYIEPFVKEIEETEDDVKPAAKTKPVVASDKTIKKGGTIYMYYNVTDTGERKRMFGLTARRVWTTQKIKPSADACTMKDSMIMKTDGWYIDLPQFNCPTYGYSRNTGGRGSYQKPDCQDRFVSKRSGKGKLGFPLVEKRTMIMGSGQKATTEFETSLETLEFSATKLDSMLFEIPPGYAEAKSEEELQDKFDVSQMVQQYRDADKQRAPVSTEGKRSGVTRIGVYEPGGDGQLQGAVLQQQLVTVLTDGKIEAIAIASEEDAKKYQCDLVLSTEFTKVKQASKVGSVLKAIKNTDPSAASAFNIEATMVLTKLSDGATRDQKKVNGKFEGKQDEAAMRALEKGWSQLAKDLN